MTTCPVCRSELAEDARVCSNCHSDLDEFYRMEERAVALTNDARALLAGAQFDEAIERANEILSLSNRYVSRANEILARAYIGKHNFAMAEEALPKVDAEDRAALVALVDELHRMERAAKEHYNLALAYSRQGIFEEATFHAEKAVKMAPHLVAPYVVLAKLKAQAGDKRAAIDHVERALAMEPDHVSARELRDLLIAEEEANVKKEPRLRVNLGLGLTNTLLIAIIILLIIQLLLRH
jgi:tetratricopeptide (TPR) repeat protein